MLKIFIGILLIYLNSVQFMYIDNIKAIVLNFIGVLLVLLGSRELFSKRKYFKGFSLSSIVLLILFVLQVILELLNKKLNIWKFYIVNDVVSYFLPIC
ncbi:hypothetical protein LJC13_01005, partial [Peptostreptococcaceae bacterium OttesenSCG-928-C18]|nr:hypothetical protein [Peptostreptococcaceae bacterium OttesenSCG-928-C18]